MNSKRLCLIIFCWIGLSGLIIAQPAVTRLRVVVAPDHVDWMYQLNEPAVFKITVLKDGNPLKNVVVRYSVGPEKMTPLAKDSLKLAEGVLTLKPLALKTAGFMQCLVTAWHEGKEYRGLATAAYAPETIAPTVENPADFNVFWEQAKTELAQMPVDARLTLLPDRCTETVNVYHVNLQNYRPGSRLYGILCMPKKEGKYPALLHVPGAGIRPYSGDVANAEKGLITLQIGIHGIPVNLDPAVYANLMSGALSNYWTINLDNKDTYYFKRVYLGCVRANDFLTGLPQYDGINLGVTGGSQGGALSIITAALDNRVDYLAAYYPALSDVTGYLHGRAGGWPHLFNPANYTANYSPAKVNTVGYYDVVNFARRLKVPGIYSWGFNDETCPPTSMYASYNVIMAPKSLFLAQETGHWTYPEQNEKLTKWIVDKLKGQD